MSIYVGDAGAKINKKVDFCTMKAVELVKISRNALEMMSKYDIKQNDWQFVPMYEEYLAMRQKREKFRYVLAYLAEKYSLSESSVRRVIRRLGREVKI